MQPTPFETRTSRLVIKLATASIFLCSAPNILDWNLATTRSESAITQNIMEGLFAQDATGFPVKNLAKSLASR